MIILLQTLGVHFGSILGVIASTRRGKVLGTVWFSRLENSRFDPLIPKVGSDRSAFAETTVFTVEKLPPKRFLTPQGRGRSNGPFWLEIAALPLGQCLRNAKGPLGASKGPLGASEGPLGASKGPLGASKGPLGASKGPLGASKGPLGASKGPLGASKDPLGASKRPLGGGPGASKGPLGGVGGGVFPNQLKQCIGSGNHT